MGTLGQYEISRSGKHLRIRGVLYNFVPKKPNSQKNKNFYLPDRGAYYSRNFGNAEELKFGNVQNVCNFGAELENLPPLAQASWVMCGFQMSHGIANFEGAAVQPLGGK